MSITATIQELNELESAGVIDRYAIGGAIGATFYIEPAETQDVDVFVHFAADPDALLVTLKPIYDFLKARGHGVEGEYILIQDWPVQFLAPDSPLVEEAIEQAVEFSVEKIPVRVFTAEHLAAIALKLGRTKDRMRLLAFQEAGVLDPGKFETILSQHGLRERWMDFQKRFLEP